MAEKLEKEGREIEDVIKKGLEKQESEKVIEENEDDLELKTKINRRKIRIQEIEKSLNTAQGVTAEKLEEEGNKLEKEIDELEKAVESKEEKGKTRFIKGFNVTKEQADDVRQEMENEFKKREELQNDLLKAERRIKNRFRGVKGREKWIKIRNEIKVKLEELVNAQENKKVNFEKTKGDKK